MKKIIISFAILAAIWPASTLADQPLPTPGMMMENLENKALGADLQEEMQNLMTKMMSGESAGLTEEETNKMIEFMNQYPGPYNMMMNRMMAQNLGWGERRDNAWGMMNWANSTGWGGWFGIFGFVTSLVWLGIGVLILIWLFKKVFEKKSNP